MLAALVVPKKPYTLARLGICGVLVDGAAYLTSTYVWSEFSSRTGATRWGLMLLDGKHSAAADDSPNPLSEKVGERALGGRELEFFWPCKRRATTGRLRLRGRYFSQLQYVLLLVHLRFSPRPLPFFPFFS